MNEADFGRRTIGGWGSVASGFVGAAGSSVAEGPGTGGGAQSSKSGSDTDSIGSDGFEVAKCAGRGEPSGDGEGEGEGVTSSFARISRALINVSKRCCYCINKQSNEPFVESHPFESWGTGSLMYYPLTSVSEALLQTVHLPSRLCE